MLHIVSFCTNPEILPVMDRLVNKRSEEWRGYRAPDLSTARQLIEDAPIDLVLLGAGTGETERVALQQLADEHGKPVRFVKHYGGGSGLLYAEIANVVG